MTFLEAVLNVLAILGFIVAVAFVLVFLIDLLLSIVDNRSGIFFKRKNPGQEQSSNKDIPTRPKVLESNELDADYQATRDSAADVQGPSWDEEKANREQQMLIDGEPGMPDEEEPRRRVSEERRNSADQRRRRPVSAFGGFDEFEEEEDDNLFATSPRRKSKAQVEEYDNEELNSMIDDINREALREYEATHASKIEDEDLPILKGFDLIGEPIDAEPEIEILERAPETTKIVAPVEPEPIKEEPVEPVVEEVKPEPETKPEPKEETKPESQEVKPEPKAEAPKPVIAKAEEPKKNTEDDTDGDKGGKHMYDDYTLDDLNARLEKLQARLKANEKELKYNRKEYNPLARVYRTLERDKQKLRRREAIVARKKVLLYGVNNYVDIDEEKARKLSEDLDLLEGLRLSVQHCEDVMEANKDRFPILEKTNQILVETNKNLKDDIAEIKAAIDKYEGENAE